MPKCLLGNSRKTKPIYWHCSSKPPASFLDEDYVCSEFELLSSLGYKVLKANDAESALIILKSGMKIDLLFTDVVMPGKLRSPELARQAQLIIPDIEVLFTSGYTQNAIVHGGRLDPGVHLLTKSYRQEQLARKVRQLLSKQAERPAEHKPTADAHPILQSPLIRNVLVVEDNIDLQQMACEMLSTIGLQVRGSHECDRCTRRIGKKQYRRLVYRRQFARNEWLRFGKASKNQTTRAESGYFLWLWRYLGQTSRIFLRHACEALYLCGIAPCIAAT
jgi:CheY-like chemotaxis protein